MRALIDGDIIVYKAGFSSETRVYKLLDESGGLVGEFAYKKEVDEFVDAFIEEGVPYEILKTSEPQPIEAALGNTKKLIENILEQTGADEYTIFLTGEGNFREELATILPYKGNRTSAKPHHYTNIQNYLISQWGAVVVPYQEADDEMGILQWENYTTTITTYGEDDTIICTIDKDLDMIPGWHYNLDKEVKYWVSEWDGIRKFYEQIVTGDRVDNIQGIPGAGAARARKVLQDCKYEEEMCRAVMQAYRESGLEYWDFWENANLLWIRREREQQYWEPPCEWERDCRVSS